MSANTVRLTSPSGVVVGVRESKAERLVAQGFTPVGAKSTPASSDSPYAGLKVAELRAEIESRNTDREDDAQLSAEGNKAALIATLTGDDEANDE